MRAGSLYRHRRCLDIDLYVLNITYSSSTYFKARVLYWNRAGYFCVAEPETVNIYYRDLHNWKFVQ